MVYSVYTDGACTVPENQKLGKIAAGYLIRTEDTLITVDLHTFQKPGLARVAEALAIAKAIEDLMSTVTLSKNDHVKIYSDCVPVIKNYKDAGKVGVRRPYFHDTRELLTWDLLCKLRSKCSWSFVWIQAHKTPAVNGNKVADRLAKYALRFM